jgi:hypothetical protein
VIGSISSAHRTLSRSSQSRWCVRSLRKVAYNHHKAGATMTAAMTTTIAVELRTRLIAIRDLDPRFMAQEELEELICLAEVLKPSA